MRNLIIVILGYLVSNPLFAYNNDLQIHITGNVKNSHYLCVSQVGCVNISQSSHGRTFPIPAGKITYLFLAEGKTYRMYPQALPKSCDVEISENQKVVVTGQVSQSADHGFVINQLACHIT